MVALLEDWMDLAIGDDVNDSADWQAMGGGTGQALVSASGFIAGMRVAAWEGTTGFGGFQTSWTNQTGVYASFYWGGVLNSGTGNVYIGKISPATDSAPGAELRVSTGKFQLRNGTSAVATSTMNAVLDGRAYRLNWRVNQTGTTQFLDIYTGANLGGTTPDETISGAYTQGNVGRLMLGSPANPNGTDSSMKYGYIGLQNSAFQDPYPVSGVQLDTPTGFVFARVSGAREIVASCTAVDGAVSYDLEVDYLSGANPAVEGDWTSLDTFNSVTHAWTLDNGDGIQWGETYRGRIVAKVT